MSDKIGDLTEISLEQLHFILIEMLARFGSFCEKQSIHYFLWAGSMLGAVRHKNMIPWDDDLDISLTRPDYERLLSIKDDLEMETGLRVINESNYEHYPFPYSKIVIPCSIVQETNRRNPPTGIFIDLFPIDGVSDNSTCRRIEIFRNRLMFFLLDLRLQKGLKPLNTIKDILEQIVLRSISFLFPIAIYRNGITKGAKKYNYESSKYVSVLTHSALAKCVIERDSLLPIKSVKFGFISSYIPNCWDQCLRQLYGDYMTPPPIREQHLKHGIRAFVDSKYYNYLKTKSSLF